MLAKPIYTITPFTLLDYPYKSACILWYAGCNMRCLYCYNPEIVLGRGIISFDKVISFLKSRQGLLDAVVFSGGECLIHKNILDQIREIKALGFLIKIDTNGSNSEVLGQLITQNLIDYVALDFKAIKSKFQEITKSNLFLEFEKSLDILLKSNIKYEIRTTYHSDLIPISDFNKMIDYLNFKKYTGNYFIQNFRNNLQTLGNLPTSTYKLNAKTNSKISIVFR